MAIYNRWTEPDWTEHIRTAMDRPKVTCIQARLSDTVKIMTHEELHSPTRVPTPALTLNIVQVYFSRCCISVLITTVRAKISVWLCTIERTLTLAEQRICGILYYRTTQNFLSQCLFWSEEPKKESVPSIPHPALHPHTNYDSGGYRNQVARSQKKPAKKPQQKKQGSGLS